MLSFLDPVSFDCFLHAVLLGCYHEHFKAVPFKGFVCPSELFNLVTNTEKKTLNFVVPISSTKHFSLF